MKVIFIKMGAPNIYLTRQGGFTGRNNMHISLIMKNFNDFYWHDSEIRKIIIDRSNPGVDDTIIIEIRWYDRGLGTLIFENVYWSRLNMNFGVVACECIDDAFVSQENDTDLTNFYKNANPLSKDLKLFCYVIKTISTNSEIKIIAKQVRAVYK